MPLHRDDIGPSAPWYEDDGIEYVGDDVLFAEAVEEVQSRLAEQLEARLERLRSPDVSMDDLMSEIRDQMTLASARANFGEARELHDLALSLRIAESSSKRAV